MIKKLLRFLPAVLVMAAIFIASSIPSQELPSFGLWDLLVKKGGHMLGYGLLALSFWYALKWDRQYFWLAFLLAAVYALSDEYHQSFVAGRNASLVDALLIDNAGALVVLMAARLRLRSRHASSARTDHP